MNARGTSEHSVTVGLPKRMFQLVSPDGHPLGAYYSSAQEAASAAGGFWPGVGQKDDDHAGWDVKVVGAE